MSNPITRIGTPTSETTMLKMRGKDTLADIVGKLTYTETLYFIVTGLQPRAGQTRCLDACLTVLMDHGITPNALVSRLVANAMPDDIQVSMAAGLMMVGSRFAGTMAGAGRLVDEGLAAGGDARVWAAAKVAEFRAAKRFVPGLGHSYYHPEDPRAARVFAVAAEAGEAAQQIAMMTVIGEEANKSFGRILPINVTGAIGAVLCGIGFPVAAMRGVAVISRAAGLVAHICEEQQTAKVGEAVTSFVNTEIDYRDPD